MNTPKCMLSCADKDFGYVHTDGHVCCTDEQVQTVWSPSGQNKALQILFSLILHKSTCLHPS